MPTDKEIRLLILQQCHDEPAAGHPGREKTYELVNRHYFWPDLYNDVRRYVSHCHDCKRSKAFHNSYKKTLLQLNVPKKPWTDIAMDYVVELPSSEFNGQTYTNILVVTDRLSKQRHLIPTSRMDAEATALLFYDHVWKLHGLPESIVSDRGTQFVSTFWRSLTDRLGIKSKLSTAYHPQTDGQSENSNQIMETYLRSYVGYLQTDWARWLPAAEFAANNHLSATTHCTLFFVVYGHHPRFSASPPLERHLLGKARLDAKDADKFAEKMTKLHNYLRTQMTASQVVYERASQGAPAPRLKVGD